MQPSVFNTTVSTRHTDVTFTHRHDECVGEEQTLYDTWTRAGPGGEGGTWQEEVLLPPVLRLNNSCDIFTSVPNTWTNSSDLKLCMLCMFTQSSGLSGFSSSKEMYTKTHSDTEGRMSHWSSAGREEVEDQNVCDCLCWSIECLMSLWANHMVLLCFVRWLPCLDTVSKQARKHQLEWTIKVLSRKDGAKMTILVLEHISCNVFNSLLARSVHYITFHFADALIQSNLQ